LAAALHLPGPRPCRVGGALWGHGAQWAGRAGLAAEAAGTPWGCGASRRGEGLSGLRLRCAVPALAPRNRRRASAGGGVGPGEGAVEIPGMYSAGPRSLMGDVRPGRRPRPTSGPAPARGVALGVAAPSTRVDGAATPRATGRRTGGSARPLPAAVLPST